MMRVRLVGDSASTAQVRELALALHRIGKTGELKVGLNGPECWTFESPPLHPQQFALVVGHLVTFEGKPVADLLPLHDGDEFSVAGTPSGRELVTVGWDGKSQPMLRYADEMHLPDSQRSVVSAADRGSASQD